MNKIDAFLLDQSHRHNIFYGFVLISSLIYELSQRGDQYIKEILTEEECVYYQKMRFFKRKIEWLAGRKAAKKAFLKYKANCYSFPDVRCLNIEKDSLGAPYISQYPEINLSISHSGEYAVAVVSDHPIGVDIEGMIENWNVLPSYFFHREEIEILSLSPDSISAQKTATLFWTKKEAVSKVLKKGGQLNFKEIVSWKDDILFQKNRICIASCFCENYCISLARKIHQETKNE